MIASHTRSSSEQPSRSNDASPSEAAKLAVTQFSLWVTNADAKAGLLATALAILGGVIVGREDSINQRFPPRTISGWAAGVSYYLSVALVILAVFFLSRVLKPRRVSQYFSRYSWPIVASLAEGDFVDAALKGDGEREAWKTAYTLALIAHFKMRNLSRAIGAATAASAFLLISTTLP